MTPTNVVPNGSGLKKVVYGRVQLQDKNEGENFEVRVHSLALLFFLIILSNYKKYVFLYYFKFTQAPSEWTNALLQEAVNAPATIDLHKQMVVLKSALEIRGVTVSIKNGTLVAQTPVGIRVSGTAKLTLDNVLLYQGGVHVGGQESEIRFRGDSLVYTAQEAAAVVCETGATVFYANGVIPWSRVLIS